MIRNRFRMRNLISVHKYPKNTYVKCYVTSAPHWTLGLTVLRTQKKTLRAVAYSVHSSESVKIFPALNTHTMTFFNHQNSLVSSV